MLRILHTESSCGWGGQELRILTESDALAARGHQLCIAAPQATPILERATEMGIEAVALPIREKSVRGWLFARDFLAQRNFDVVNTHSSTDSWLTALAVIGLANRPALVRTRHVSTAVRPGRVNRWLYGRATSRVVTTGEVIRQALIERLQLSPSHVVSIPTGVSSVIYHPPSSDEKILLRRKLGIPSECMVIGTVATLRKLKGVDHLLEAIHRIRSLPIHLVIVGDGPQAESLSAVRRDLGIESLVTMVGRQSNVQEWLQGMDIFALPSLAEGVPQALTQAMLTGLPCVTTDVGGIPELASHLRTAWVCPPSDVAALAHGLEALVVDAALREKLGRAARTHCVATRSVARMADAMELVFHEALHAPR